MTPNQGTQHKHRAGGSEAPSTYVSVGKRQAQAGKRDSGRHLDKSWEGRRHRGEGGRQEGGVVSAVSDFFFCGGATLAASVAVAGPEVTRRTTQSHTAHTLCHSLCSWCTVADGRSEKNKIKKVFGGRADGRRDKGGKILRKALNIFDQAPNGGGGALP